MGMSPKSKNSIFEAFSTNDRNTNSEGVGLGLLIVKELVNQLGPKQELEVESVLG